MVIASIAMNTPLGPHIVIPGPLTAQHAMLETDCLNCHAADMSASKGVLHGLVNSELSLQDSARCLDCHDIGKDALLAHALPASDIKERTEQFMQRVSVSNIPPAHPAPPPHSPAGEIACAVCHAEHNGRAADLTAITTAQCQTCHAATFKSFHNGHPGFGNYPYERRLRIAFDHAEHIYENFPTKENGEAPTSCTVCHTPDQSGSFMRTASFENSCARCHEPDVRATARSDGAGISFFALPAIDTMSIDDAGLALGNWPADAAIAEGELTPFMRLILSADPAIKADLAVTDTLDLLDLQDATDDELAAVTRVAWAIKSLAQDLASNGHAALLTSASHAVESTTPPSSHLAGGLSRTLLHDSISAWLPELETELATRAAGNPPPTNAMEDTLFDETRAPGQAWAAHGGWYRDDMDFALKYRPAGHRDSFLKAWADLAVASVPTSQPLLDELMDHHAVGQCLTCHSVDESPGGTRTVNWHARKPDDTANSLTRFRHAPHLPLLGDDGCLQCHTVSAETPGFERAYEQHNPAIFSSALAPMNQADCATCHTTGKVELNCMDCHNYHAQRPSTRLRNTAPLRPIEPAPE